MVFEDLEAWQAARKSVNLVYQITREGSLSRDFGLKDQIQRAAVSVMTNTAEGFERTGTQEKLHFYNIAKAFPPACRPTGQKRAAKFVPSSTSSKTTFQMHMTRYPRFDQKTLSQPAS